MTDDPLINFLKKKCLSVSKQKDTWQSMKVRLTFLQVWEKLTTFQKVTAKLTENILKHFYLAHSRLVRLHYED